MRSVLLLCFVFTQLAGLSQRYDISVGVDPVSTLNAHDSMAGYIYKSRQSTIQYYVKFGYVLNHDLEVRVGYKFGLNSLHTEYEYPNSGVVNSGNEKILLQSVDASVLKIIRYKFLYFMAGGTFYYGYQPAYTTSQLNNGLPNGAYTISDYTGPHLHSFGFYINTSLYFRIYKFLYAGMDITNGFLVDKWIGNANTTTLTYAANGTTQGIANNQTIRWNEVSVNKSLLNMDIGLKFLFDTKKQAKRKVAGKDDISF